MAGQFPGYEWIIPAYAGSTVGFEPLVVGMSDHPRVCGEHVEPIPDRLVEQGSSPRMRGAPRGQPVPGSQGRIIPAYAGSTPWC